MIADSASTLSPASSYRSPIKATRIFGFTFLFRALRFLGIGLLYFMASDIGLALGSKDAQADVIWPANGVLLGLILLSPRRYWVDYLVSSVVANVLLHMIFSFPPSEIVIFSIANVIEVLIAAFIIRPRHDDLPDLTRPEILRRFLIGGIILAPLCSGVLVGVCESYLGYAPDFYGVRDWILGDGLGIGIMTPLVLAMRRSEVIKLLGRGKRQETIVLLAGLCIISVAIFGQRIYPITFLLIPLLLLVVFRLGAAGGAIGIVLLSAPGAYYTVRTNGPFSLLRPGSSLIDSILMLQLFLCVLIIMVYVVGSILAERTRLQNELTESHRQMEMLANLDSLTQLPNRRSLELRLHEEWQRAIREQACLSALMVDVDHFKMFNDRHGHLAGDSVLRAIGEILQVMPRRATDFACRFGGEEFVILLPQTNSHQAALVADRLRQAVSDMKLIHEHVELSSITISIGIATSQPEVGDQSAKLLIAADEELYRAKSNGRNRVCRRQMLWTMTKSEPVVGQEAKPVDVC